MSELSNKGTGAGGAKTNYYGKKFEEKTNNQNRLIENGYIINNFKNPPKNYMIIYQKLMKIKQLYLYYNMD
uniref:Uncharacterized protein n=1 Tax=viral metagenome TaxID=1070528 RepID=A0A6C0EQ71_9ZZZZ